MLITTSKSYNDLTKDELYAILRLRSEVFVVEQDCVYQDIDNKDQKAHHVLGYYNSELVAYTRLFNKGDYFNECSIGRVIVKENYRDNNYGNVIMKFSIKCINDFYNSSDIRISAQTYLLKFYTNLGFNKVGETYLEDGIPHINMIYKK